MINLKDITFGYNSPSAQTAIKNGCVLNKLNFHFKKGDRIGLVGHNGSGKTTLFCIMMGLLKPLEGEVEIFGKTRQTEQDFRGVREKIGFLFQDPDDQLFCPTVAEDIAFGPFNLGKSRDEAIAIVKETLSSLGIPDFGEKVTYNLSGGEKRLVSFAAVLAMKSEILLLDEATTGLDENSTERIIGILNNSNFSYIITSHDREFLERTTCCIYKLNDGKIENE